MLLVDKGYFDYDYEKMPEPEIITTWEDTVKTDEEVQDILSIFGVGQRAPETIDDIQEYIIKQESYGS